MNQLVDSIDSEGVWYRSTVLDLRETPLDDSEMPNAPPIKEALIAYRYYSEEEGHKNDEEKNGAKFVGWSSKYDEWIPVTSPKI